MVPFREKLTIWACDSSTAVLSGVWVVRALVFCSWKLIATVCLRKRVTLLYRLMSLLVAKYQDGQNVELEALKRQCANLLVMSQWQDLIFGHKPLHWTNYKSEGRHVHPEGNWNIFRKLALRQDPSSAQHGPISWQSILCWDISFLTKEGDTLTTITTKKHFKI